MFIPKAVVDWFVSLKTVAETQAAISLEAITITQKENAALTAENRNLTEQVIRLNVTQDWFRMKINQLEAERALLLEKAYGIHVPVPEIAKLENRIKDGFDLHALFEDVGDKRASELGYQTSD